MALKYVTYRTYQPLCCTEGQNIVMAITPSIARNGKYFLQSAIGSAVERYDDSGKKYYEYSFSYDPVTQLVDGVDTLVQNDIGSVFCKSTLTDYIESLTNDFAGLVQTSEADIRADLTRKYYPPFRAGPTNNIGIVTGLAIWATPTSIKTLGNSFTNDSDKPVWVHFQFETPELALTLASGQGFSFDYDYTITNDGDEVANVPNVPIGGFKNPQAADGAYFAIPNAITGILASPFKVLPGKTISIAATLKINPSNGTGDADNQIQILGPWINYQVFPAEV